MKIIFISVSAFLLGSVLSLILIRLSLRTAHKKAHYRSERQTHKKTHYHAKTPAQHKKRMETTKKVIWVCLANGFAWVWCSYILAYLDKVQIAESLSQVAVTEIIGVVLAYCIKSAVENLSKNNNWPDKQPQEGAEDVTGKYE